MTEKIRVVMVIHNYFPVIGGAERVLASLSPELMKNNIEVYILTRQTPGTSAFELISGVPVFRLPSKGPKAFASLSFTLSALRMIWKLKPDIVHSHIMFSPATIGLIAKLILKTGFVITVHRSGPAPYGEIERLKQLFMGNLRLKLFRRYADRFIVISREIDAELSVAGIKGNEKIIIPNAVDTDYFYALSYDDKQKLRQKLGLNSKHIAVFIGRLSPEKQVHLLLTIWPEIRKVHSDAMLLIVGEGPDAERLKSSAPDGVVFTGGVSDTRPFFQVADIFVLPSLAEGLSIAMLEAMASALPAVVTDLAGATDIITHNKNGWLIPPGNIPLLEQGIKELFSDDAIRESIGQQGRNHIIANYSLNSAAEQLRNLYGRIIASSKENKLA
jgi:glycosyltransferase involved in cell wall biosynthesis